MDNKKLQEIIEKQRAEIDHFKDNYWMVSHWLEASIAGVGAHEYFDEMGYKNIAIYGMGEMANRLMDDLEANGDIKVLYGIDRDVAATNGRLEDIYSLSDELPQVDAIVVTPIYAFDIIKQALVEKCRCDIVSLEEVVWSL